MTNEWVKIWPQYLLFKMPKLHPHGSVTVPRQHKQTKDICYTKRYQSSVFCLADPYVPCCPGLCDPQA